MVEERDGWFVVNVRDASWKSNAAFGKTCLFEGEKRRFRRTGVHLFVLEPGKPACLYHRENAQEDFLVLSGQCKLLVNGEERLLKAWDYVHCPPGVTHVLVGAGEGPSAFLAIGHRPAEHELHYPKNELAARYGAEAPEATPDPRVAYAAAPPTEDVEAPWPID